MPCPQCSAPMLDPAVWSYCPQCGHGWREVEDPTAGEADVQADLEARLLKLEQEREALAVRMDLLAEQLRQERLPTYRRGQKR